MYTLVIQSYRQRHEPRWLATCMDSVQEWAHASGFDYRFVDDAIFESVPAWYRQKLHARTPIVTDLGRLKLLYEALEAGYEQAVWFDADTLVFDSSLRLEFAGDCAFGQETWIQPEPNGRLTARRNVHNAVCVFRRHGATLPFLIQTVESIIRRADPAHIAPQMVGPKLLSALHGIAGFALLPQVGAVSPAVTADICAGEGPALDLLRQRTASPLQAANLCRTLLDDVQAERLVGALVRGSTTGSAGAFDDGLVSRRGLTD